MKRVPFQSAYSPDFEVVEERRGNVVLFPHTEQLPKLLRSISNDFFLALPPKIAKIDSRADGFHKLMLKGATMAFCSCINAARRDYIRLHALTTPDMVARVTVVQRLTQHEAQGRSHRFRFFGGEDFFPEIHILGKTLTFSDHALQRFSTRVENSPGEDLSNLLLTFYSYPLLALPANSGQAFFVPYFDSLLAFTFKETDDEVFVTTCLSPREINTMKENILPKVFNLHYGPQFTPVKLRNWIPLKEAADLYDRWERKVPMPLPQPPAQPNEWFQIAANLKTRYAEVGHGPGSRHCFMDNIPGPCCFEFFPTQEEPQIDELNYYNELGLGPPVERPVAPAGEPRAD
jgi:hypothetical protein